MNSFTLAGLTVAAWLVAGSVSAGQAPAPGQPQTLPGGASQLQETHGDWRVTCVQQGGARLCSALQQQTEKESGQLAVGIELKAMPGDAFEGTIVLPFGVAVDKPVAFLLDDALTMSQPYRTCLPVGCIVAMKLDARAVAQFSKATTLTLRTATVAAGQEVTFKISLNGFASALARTAALMK
jgi:invasion protein IalB